MEKKSQDFSLQEAMRLAESPAGKQLLALLQQQDQGQVNEAITQANAGNSQQASKILEALLTSPEAKALLRQLRR